MSQYADNVEVRNGVQIRRYGAEVSLPTTGDRREFDRWSLQECGITTIAEIMAFCIEVTRLGGTSDTKIAVGQSRMWVLVPHPEEATQ